MYKLPANIVGHDIKIEVDAIPSDIPMLLSKDEMILYMLVDKAEVHGSMISLSTTSAGHYLLPLLTKEEKTDTIEVDSVLTVNLTGASYEEKCNALRKIHKQFGHRPKQVMKNLLQSAEA